VAAESADVVECFYGDPTADLVRLAGAGGARVGWQVGSAEEAAGAVGAGCDYAGQLVDAVTAVQPAHHIVAELTAAAP
jgi:hypothetical protein